MIRFEQVGKTYSDKQVVAAFEATIHEGELFVLVGPSGSGKTTTLKMINRLIEPTTGTIYLQDKPLTEYPLRQLRLSIGYVLQQIALFPTLTVAENIELIPEMKKWPKEKRREQTIRLLKRVNLDPDKYLHRKPSELSGGEQQRIGILRALAADPDVILMDEPFSALDPISRTQLQDLIKELHRDLKSTIVFVTHDMDEAIRLGDRICVMKDGEIVQIATPQVIQQAPANEFVAQFFTKQQSSLTRYQAKELLPFITKTAGTSVVPIADTTSLMEVITRLNQEEVVVIETAPSQFGEITQTTILQFLEEVESVGGVAHD